MSAVEQSIAELGIGLV